MERNTVASSNVASIGYDEEAQTLEVEFLNGSVYQYYNVPNNMHDEIMRASSKGRFLNTYIKNAYPFRGSRKTEPIGLGCGVFAHFKIRHLDICP